MEEEEEEGGGGGGWRYNPVTIFTYVILYLVLRPV